MTTNTNDLVERIEKYFGGWVTGGDLQRLKRFIHQEVFFAKEEERREIGTFLENVLDGIDIADAEMKNVGGGTKAIRFALVSRGLIRHQEQP